MDHNGGLPSKNEEKRIQELQDQHRQFLQIPRRYILSKAGEGGKIPRAWTCWGGDKILVR